VSLVPASDKGVFSNLEPGITGLSTLTMGVSNLIHLSFLQCISI